MERFGRSANERPDTVDQFVATVPRLRVADVSAARGGIHKPRERLRRRGVKIPPGRIFAPEV
jgi:hypothetical protein